MKFQKAAGKVFGVQLNRKEEEILNQWIAAEVKKELQLQMVKMEKDLDAAVLWVLHNNFNFGQKRLRNVWDMVVEEYKALVKHYELDPEDGVFICKQKLKDHCDVDLDAWYSE